MRHTAKSNRSTAHQGDRSWPRLLLCDVLVALGVVVLYLVSFDPALSLAQRQVVPLRFVLLAYRPLPLSFQQQYLTVWARLDSQCSRVREKMIDDLVLRRIQSEFGNRAAVGNMLQAKGMTYEKFRQQVKQEIEATTTKH